MNYALFHTPFNPTTIDGEIYFDDINTLTKPSNRGSFKALFKVGTIAIFDPAQFFKPAFVNATGIRTFYQLLDVLPNDSDRGAFSSLYQFLERSRDYRIFEDGSYNYYPDLSSNQEYLKRQLKDYYADFGLLDWMLSSPEVWSHPNYDRYRGISSPEIHTFFNYSQPQQEEVPTIQYARVVHRPGNMTHYPVDWFAFQIRMPTPRTSGHTPLGLFEGVIAGDIKNYSCDASSVLASFRRAENEFIGEAGFESYFGVELEVCSQLSGHELQYIVQRVEPVQQPFFILKSDGSISGSYNYKYEIVTVPMSYRSHKEEWKKLFTKLSRLCDENNKTLGDVFYATPSTGLHVHLSKAAFSNVTTALRKFGKSWECRFLAAFNSDYREEIDLLTQVSKRDYKDNRYCGISGSTFRGKRVSFRVGADKLGQYNTKYTPAHNNKAKTVEVRIFSGDVSYEHVMTSIELVKAMYHFTRDHGGPSCVRFARKFKEWIFTQPGLTYLKKEFK